MGTVTLHHYGFLTSSTADWLAENETFFGQPFRVFDTIKIQSQKVDITFVEQTQGATLTELVEPWEDNLQLHKMINKGLTVYHKGLYAAMGKFDEVVERLEEMGAHSLGAFQSEAFGNKRCVFLITRNLGMIEIIEQ